MSAIAERVQRKEFWRLVHPPDEVDLGLFERQAEQREEQLDPVRVAGKRKRVQADRVGRARRGGHRRLHVQAAHLSGDGRRAECLRWTLHSFAARNAEMDRLEGMKIFVTVADTRGFAPAARQLGLSAPAVSRAIVALEEHVGARLLRRTTRSVALTEAGERFHADCKRILADLAEAEASVGGAHAEPQGQLAITAPRMFGRIHVTPVLLGFLAAHPKVSARTFFADHIVHLLDEGFDVAVRIAHLPDSGLTAVRVGHVRRVIVASPDYLAARGVPRAPADLAAVAGQLHPRLRGRAVRLVLRAGRVQRPRSARRCGSCGAAAARRHVLRARRSRG